MSPTTESVHPADLPIAEVSTATVLDVRLAVTNYAEVMEWMDEAVRRRERHNISAAAVHLIMVAQEDAETKEAIREALVVPDGQPLVWAMRALGHAHASRVYGPELMARYCERSASTGTTMFLYGGRNQGALVQLALELRKRYPGLKIVGGYSPPYRPLSEEEEAWITGEINRSRADVVWVGTGQPKQEKWMAGMRSRLETPLLIGVGAAFDFHAGLVPQAPSWMQSTGLEWVFRLLHEPRRLWRRYARYNPRFVLGFGRQWLAAYRHR